MFFAWVLMPLIDVFVVAVVVGIDVAGMLGIGAGTTVEVTERLEIFVR